ncbi:hypothetical protein CTAYLR_007771 [Chrysophaeum taylorii]|uniref:SGNH hydrolase-type esterase domain-containing protein n=1 Tax=Chrysophaeum taylorii TaxID=2483200 RepID=A0AAD7UKJ9_9STRA|nr:hypothetical protein CTAYLR_007771 [Chrysophaeum taylorii]
MAATLATVLLFAALAWPAAPWTISCVGDSITEEGGASSSDDAYPAVLEGLLGSGFEVKNFGRSGATMMEIEGESYRDRDEYEEALESEPDVVTIMLGTNDAKGEFWGTLIDDPEDQYVESYVDLIATFQALDTKPRVVAMIPVPQLEESSKWPDSDVINEASRDSCFVIPAREFNYFLQILPDLVADVAAQSNIDVIDMRVPFGDPPDEDYYKDGIHPNDDGNEAMAAHLSTELSRLGLLAPATYAPTYAPTPRPANSRTVDKAHYTVNI